MIRNKTKIDNIDMKLLFELDKNSKISVTQLTKKLRISREIAKYRLKKLADKKIIKNFTTLINPAKFGYLIYKVYLKLQNLTEEKEKLLEEFLTKNKKVFWATNCQGNYDLIFGVYVKSIIEFDEFLLEFTGKFGMNIASRHISNSTYVEVYRKKYLTKNDLSQIILWGGIPSEEKIDGLMKNILGLIAGNSRISIIDICKKLNTTPKTVISKIKQMERQKIILGYRILLDLKKLDKENFKVIIYFQNISPERERAFREFCRLDPDICYYIKTVGEWDIELDIEIENYKKFYGLLKRIRNTFRDIIKDMVGLYISNEFKGELNIIQIYG